MGSDLKPCPLPEGFEPMSDRQIAKNRRVADAIGQNNVRRYTWKRASKEQEARGWASTVTLTMESSVQHNNADMLAGFVNVAAEVLTYALDSLRFERARAEAAEQRAEALAAEVARLRVDALLILGRYRGIDDCFDGEDRLGLGDDECEALDALSETAFASTDDVAAAIGRMLAKARPAGEVADV